MNAMESIEFMVVQFSKTSLVFLTDGFTVHPLQIMKQRYKFMKCTSKSTKLPIICPHQIVEKWEREKERERGERENTLLVKSLHNNI